MSLILLLESSGTNCSVALAQDGEILAIREQNEGYSHSEHMASFVDEVFSQSAKRVEELDAIAVGKGPGSYTGLRIGVSLAKGLAYSHAIPLISIESLQVLALAAKHFARENDLIIPMIDARRMEVYTAIYNSNCERITPIKAQVLEPDSFAKEAENHSLFFCGDGSSKYSKVCSAKNVVFIEGAFPSARFMLDLAEQKFRDSDFEDTAYFEPFYLKEFLAIKPKNPLQKNS